MHTEERLSENKGLVPCKGQDLCSHLMIVTQQRYCISLIRRIRTVYLRTLLQHCLLAEPEI